MLQRNASPMRASLWVLTIGVALFGVMPYQVAAQAIQAEGRMPVSAPAMSTPPTPSDLPPLPPTPLAPPTALHPTRKSVGTHANGEHVHHVHVLDDSVIITPDEVEDVRAAKLQPPDRVKKRMLENKQRSRGREQWLLGERQRVANEAARREAERMINAASPMDWRNRYSSD